MSNPMPWAGSLLTMLALPYLGSVAVALLPTRARNMAAAFSGVATLAALAILFAFYPAVSAGEVPTFRVAWIPALGLDFVLRLGGFSWLFALLVLGIGALVILYARYYMSAEDPVPRFFSFLLAFMGAMLGIVLSGNLIEIAFFWELTSIFSFLLIGYWHHNQLARDGARVALVVTAAGGVCLLIGFLLLGRIAGGYDLDVVLAAGGQVRESPLYPVTLIFILIGAFTKSAQFPFHFWLPHAMAAPTPVSSYLHSATLVKAGVYVLTLLWPVLAGTELWFLLVAGGGLATLLVGAWSAIFQQDLKGLLAYSTISHLGLIILLLGLGSPLAAVAAIFHIVNHATFKASLFMAAGIIDHETGTRDLRRLSGLMPFMPITATLAMVATAAMAGVPLLNGFLSKEMFHAEALAVHSDTVLDQWLPALATLASTFSVLYSVRFIHQTFLGPKPRDLPKEPHEAPYWMRLPVETLVLLCLLIGLVPAITIGPILDMAARSVLGSAMPYYSLAIWHGFNLPLLMSTIALVGGVGLYILFGKRLNARHNAPLIGRLKGKRAFETTLAGIVGAARAVHGFFGTLRQQPQLRVLVLVAILAGLWPAIEIGGRFAFHRPQAPDPAFLLLWVAAGAGAIGAAWSAKYHRFSALVMMGVAGLVTCITFIWVSAPDLALTQLLVEIVTLVLLLLGLRWLPRRIPALYETIPFRVRLRRGLDLVMALVAGAGMALFSYTIMMRDGARPLARFFLQEALPQGGGANVVNVILVDFRGFDTLGEITVLAVVALTVFTLLRRFRPAPESVRVVEGIVALRVSEDPNRYRLIVPRVTMEWLFPVILVLAFYILTRGHDLPGGGFAAGVAMAIALILLYMANGTKIVEARLGVHPLWWIGTGLTLAIGAGLVAWLAGEPFLFSLYGRIPLPFLDELQLPTAFLFDIGVFTVVVGVSALILITLAHQSIRIPRSLREEEALADEPEGGG